MEPVEKERFVKLEKDVDYLKEGFAKLNLIIVGNGNKGLAETARDIFDLAERTNGRVSCLEQKHLDIDKEERLKLLNSAEKKRDDTNKIVLGIISALILQIVLSLLRNPEILGQLFN